MLSTVLSALFPWEREIAGNRKILTRSCWDFAVSRAIGVKFFNCLGDADVHRAKRAMNIAATEESILEGSRI
jgi:hypothetical protein